MAASTPDDTATPAPRVALVMGVAASGKTTVGRALAAALRWGFADADDFHPPANVDKMRRGEPLDDDDRGPWLDALRTRIVEALDRPASPGLVVTSSALRRRYRRRLIRPGEPVALVYLRLDRATMADRLARRSGHFFPARLMDSQLDALEEPGEAESPITLDAARPTEELVDTARRAMGI